MRKKTRFFYYLFWYSVVYLILSFIGFSWFKNISSGIIFLFSLVLSGLTYYSAYKACMEPIEE